MACIFKHKTGTYFAKFFDADGRRVSKNTWATSKRDAQRIATEMEVAARTAGKEVTDLQRNLAAIVEAAAREAAAGELTLARAEELVMRLHKAANPDFRRISLRDYWSQWIRDQAHHVSPSSFKGYSQDLKVFADAFGKRIMDAPVGDLTADQVKAATLKAHSDDRRASTVNKALSGLRRVMEAAIASGHATHNPAKQARSLRQTDSIKRAPFTIAEVRAMIDNDQTSDEWKGAITIAAYTGLRMGDVLGLASNHIEGDRIVVMPTKTRNTTGDVVSIPLTPPCLAWISGRKGAFFPTLAKLQKGTASTQFARIMQRAGIAKEIEMPGGAKAQRSFHSLRHSFASWLAEADIHADVRQKLTGHKSAGIHQRYTHHDQALDRAVAALPTL